jgi:hypothetical protein
LTIGFGAVLGDGKGGGGDHNAHFRCFLPLVMIPGPADLPSRQRLPDRSPGVHDVIVIGGGAPGQAKG